MTYRERLLVPVWWWCFGAFMVFGMVLAVWAWWGTSWGIATAVGFGAALVALLALIGSARVVVDERGIEAGGARLEWAWAGEVTPLDASETQRALGVDADPSAYLLTRPYIRTAVRIDVDDAADPHPYWLVSTRHPDAVVAAVAGRESR